MRGRRKRIAGEQEIQRRREREIERGGEGKRGEEKGMERLREER